MRCSQPGISLFTGAEGTLGEVREWGDVHAAHDGTEASTVDGAGGGESHSAVGATMITKLYMYGYIYMMMIMMIM